MSLKLLQSGVQPLGQFDLLDTDAALLGGEVLSLTSILANSSDKASHDVFDGYVNSQKRVVATRYNRADGYGPYFLADEGITGYGTLFGVVFGGTLGQAQAGVVLGPHTTTGSGKVTLWDKPGLYAVSLDDACDQDNDDGLIPGNAALNTGTALTFCPTITGLPADYGKLTMVGSSRSAGNTSIVGRFVSFETKQSLVTTPNYLVSALSSAKTYEFMVFHFNPVH